MPSGIYKRNNLCLRGHDKNIVGRDLQGHCLVCKHARIKEYYLQNKERMLADDLRYQNTRYRVDPLFRLKRSLRGRLAHAIKRNYKVGSAVKDLGCSIEFFKNYIESKFYGSMTWSNWGEVWELDHIKELHTFDLTDRDQFLKACNYMNLQPLTIEDHKKKTRGDNNENNAAKPSK